MSSKVLNQKRIARDILSVLRTERSVLSLAETFEAYPSSPTSHHPEARRQPSRATPSAIEAEISRNARYPRSDAKIPKLLRETKQTRFISTYRKQSDKDANEQGTDTHFALRFSPFYERLRDPPRQSPHRRRSSPNF